MDYGDKPGAAPTPDSATARSQPNGASRPGADRPAAEADSQRALSALPRPDGEANHDDAQRYRTLIEMLPDAVFLIDSTDGSILDANPAAVNLYGYTREQLVSMNHTDVSVQPEATRTAALTGLQSIPLRYHHKRDGTVFPVEITASHLVWRGRQAHIASIRDVSDREDLQTALAKAAAEAHLHRRQSDAMLAAGRDLLELHDFRAAAGALLERCRELLGTESGVVQVDDALGGCHLVSSMDTGGRRYDVATSLAPPVSELRDRALASSSPVWDNALAVADANDVLPGGPVSHVNALFAPIMSDDKCQGFLALAGKPDGFDEDDARVAGAFAELLSVALARSRTRAALEQSEQRYRAVVEEQLELVVRYLPDSTITFANDAFCRFLGLTAEEVIGSQRWPIEPAEEHDAARVSPDWFSPERPTRLSEHRAFATDGSLRWHEWSDRAFFDHDGRVIELQSVGRDITEQKLAGEALQESRALQQAMFEHPGFGMCLLDLQGRYLQANARFLEMVGYSLEELTQGDTHLSLAFGEDVPAALDRLRSLESGLRGGYQVEKRLIRKDGTVFWALISSAPVVGPDGEVKAASVVVSDISARKGAEEDRNVALQKYRTLFESFPMGITISDEAGNIIEVNTRSQQLLGLDREAHTHRSLSSPDWHFIRPDGTRVAPAEYTSARALREGRLLENVEMGVVKEGGEVTWISVTAAPLPLPGYGVAVAYGDVTERKAVDQALREYERAVEESQDLICVIDREYRYVLANAAYCRYLGLTAEEVVGRTMTEVLGPAVFASDAKELADRAFAGEAAEGLTERYHHRSSRASHFQARYYPVGDGDISRVVVLLRDVTEQVERDRERELTVELLRLINQINSSHDMMSDVTALLQSYSGCEAVGIRLREGDDYPYFESRGFPPEFVEAERYLCQRDEDGQPKRDAFGNPVLACMCGKVIGGRFSPGERFFTDRGSFWTNSITEYVAAAGELGRQCLPFIRCHEAGYESVAVIPLRSAGETHGLLQLNDRRPGMFTPEAIALFETLSDSIAIALSHRQAQAALAVSERRYRELFQESMSGFALHEIIVDEKGQPCDYRFLELNPAFERLTGLRRDDVLGRTVLEVLPGTEPIWIERYGRVALTGEPDQFESHSAVLGRHYEIRAYCPQPGQFAVLFHDITDRVRAEDALRQSEREASLVFNSVSDAVFIHELDGPFLMVNDSACRSLGYSREELLSMAPMDITAPEYADRLPTAVEELGDGTTVVQEVGHITKDGRRIPVELSSTIIIFRDRLAFLTVSRDLSERKQAEEERAVLQSQLLQAQKMESIGRLAGGVAHDFNNVITAISGFAGFALEQLEDRPEVQRDIEEVVRNADRAASLTRQLLVFSRKQLIDKQIVDLNTLIRDMGKMLGRLIGEHIDLVSVLNARPSLLSADPAQIEQALLNLVLNARDAMPAGGRLTVTTNTVNLPDPSVVPPPAVPPGRYVRLQVEDTGVGMTEEVLSHIFEPFYTTKAVGEGTGLGLPIVYGVVKQHGGDIQVVSTPGAGTAFTVYLPLASAAEVLEPEQASAAAATPGGETVLLVEDEPSVREITRRILTGLGYHVLEAGNGDEAVAMVARLEEPPDLVVTDLVMPKMGGAELVGKLHAAHPHLRVLYTSGYSEVSPALQAAGSSSDSYLAKPFTSQALADKVRAALDRPA